MSRNSNSIYDRQITIFSPEGKLFQVEYAFRAVNSANITVVGLKSTNCAVLVGHKKVSSQALQQDKLLDPLSLSSFHNVTQQIGGAFVGFPADCRAMVFRAREKASEFERENAYPVPIHYLTHKVANINQVFTQHAYMRLHACVGMMIGIDQEQGPSLYRFDPAGWYTGNKAAAIGSKEVEATAFFENILKETTLRNEDDAIISSIICLQHILGLEFKSTDLEVACVTIEKPEFRTLPQEDIEKYLNLVSDRE